ncbi:ABC transporter substrate-binding protein [Clostridium sp. AL.422]|uniref:ABC transporter substrate-binding protein n=1 Tax=Clostridium TaxID=1485 RepID=UPI00293DB047|nr:MULTISPECIES: ABC transporter substrate-binding protein [unclassified Clostridium]MDV4152298.1 ABC transporter substrate-binding protein [Clostridium sp. AL.422]
MKKKMISVLTLALTGVLVLGGCKKVETPPTTTTPVDTSSAVEGYIPAADPSKNPVTDRKDTLVVGIDAPEEVFNPLYAESAYDVYITNTVFEGLLTVDGAGMPVEALVEKYEISDDGLKYTFTLKDGLKFSDGSPLTTEDVAFTYIVGSDATYDGPTDFVNSTKIKGAKAYKEGTASTIEGINIIDDKNIEFTLEEVNADAIYDFTAGILSKAYYGKDYTQGSLDYIKGFHKTPLGAGQYKLVKTVAGQEVTLVANENYHLGKPNIPNIIYKVTSQETRMQMLTTGEIDMDMVTVSQDNVQALKDSQFLDLHIFPTNGYGYIGFNFTNPKFQDQKVRQALAYGLNRKEVVDAVYAGGFADVINVPQSKLSWAYAEGENDYEYNKEKAIELLEEAGWKVGSDGIREKDGVKLEIKFTASSPNSVNDALIPIAQANYKEIGVKFEAEQMEFNGVLEKVDNGSVEMYFMAWGLTPAADSTGVFGTGGAQNKISYSNAKVDELLAAGVKETDIEKRKEIYKELYNVLNEDLPYIYLYQRRDMWAVNSRVKGFENEITPYKDFWQSLYKLTLE